jgi:hypothetical protein
MLVLIIMGIEGKVGYYGTGYVSDSQDVYFSFSG